VSYSVYLFCFVRRTKYFI